MAKPSIFLLLLLIGVTVQVLDAAPASGESTKSDTQTQKSDTESVYDKPPSVKLEPAGRPKTSEEKEDARVTDLADHAKRFAEEYAKLHAKHLDIILNRLGVAISKKPYLQDVKDLEQAMKSRIKELPDTEKVNLEEKINKTVEEAKKEISKCVEDRLTNLREIVESLTNEIKIFEEGLVRDLDTELDPKLDDLARRTAAAKSFNENKDIIVQRLTKMILQMEGFINVIYDAKVDSASYCGDSQLRKTGTELQEIFDEVKNRLKKEKDEEIEKIEKEEAFKKAAEDQQKQPASEGETQASEQPSSEGKSEKLSDAGSATETGSPEPPVAKKSEDTAKTSEKPETSASEQKPKTDTSTPSKDDKMPKDTAPAEQKLKKDESPPAGGIKTTKDTAAADTSKAGSVAGKLPQENVAAGSA